MENRQIDQENVKSTLLEIPCLMDPLPCLLNHNARKFRFEKNVSHQAEPCGINWSETRYRITCIKENSTIKWYANGLKTTERTGGNWYTTC